MGYKIRIVVKTGFIVWVNGPFPCGMGSDADIAQLSLHHELEPWEGYIADGVYRRIMGVARTPTGLHNMADRTEALARARHECVNKRFKEFTCLKTMFQHNRADHYQWFAPCALMVQLMIEDEEDEGTFQVDYEEFQFGSDRN